MMECSKAPRLIIPSSTAARGRFKGYKPEHEDRAREPDIARDERLSLMMNAWRALSRNAEAPEPRHVSYKDAQKIAKRLRCTSEEISRFSLALEALQDDKVFFRGMGTYLSALINWSPDREFTIHTRHLESQIDVMCMHNTKSIVIEGNAEGGVGAFMRSGIIIVDGWTAVRSQALIPYVSITGYKMAGGLIWINGDTSDVGKEMENGCIVVEGKAIAVGEKMGGGRIIVKKGALDAGFYMKGGFVEVSGNMEYAGAYMSGGELSLHGDICQDAGANMSGGTMDIFGSVCDNVGARMSGGWINVHGDAFGRVGDGMDGGEIHIDGDIAAIGHVYGGRIFHQGKLIVDMPDVK